MTDENDEQRTPFGSIGGEDQQNPAPAPPPPPAAQAPTSPAAPSSPVVPPAPVAPTAPVAPAAPSTPTPPQPAASSFNTVSPGPAVAAGAHQATYQQGSYQPPEKKSKAGWIIGGVVLLFLVLGGGVIAALALFGSSDDDTVAAEAVVEEEEVVDEPADEIDSDTGTEVDDVDADVETDEPTDELVEDDDDSDVPLGTVTDPVEEDVTTIEVVDGDVLEIPAEIAANGFDVYLLQLDAGSSVEVTAQSSDDQLLDSMMRVLDPDGAQIAFNDDAEVELPFTFDPQVNFVAETAGLYTIEVLGFDAVTEGEYLLTINRTGEPLEFEDVGGAITTPDGDDDDEGGFLGVEDEVVLTVGPNEVEVVEASIEDTQFVDLYEFDLEVGETVRIAAVADADTELDLAITAFDADLNIIGFDDDAGPLGVLATDLNPELEFIAPATDTFFFDVLAFTEATGGYTLTVERGELNLEAIEAEELADIPSSLFLESGDSITVAGVVGGEDAFDLILDIGDEVTVTVEADDPDELDPTVTLEFGGWAIDFNDDASDSSAVASQFDSQLSVFTGNSGIHTITVGGFSGTTGPFTMTVERN